jgi:hypothetical protein
MEEVRKDTKIRDQVLKWIRSRDHSYSAGIAILKASGYKPHVTKRIEQWGDGTRSVRALHIELRNYLRYLRNPDNAVHEDIDPEDNSRKDGDPTAEKPFKGNIEKELQQEYPDAVKRLLNEYSDLYKGRSILHRQLKDVGENNSETSTGERKRLLLIIDSTSRRMEDLWKAFHAWKYKNEIQPVEALLTEPFDPERDSSEPEEEPEAPEASELPSDMEALKKMKENLRIKISKTENRLNFQEEKKMDAPNPVPKGPKRIELEKRLEKLKAQKEAVEVKIAEMK